LYHGAKRTTSFTLRYEQNLKHYIFDAYDLDTKQVTAELLIFHLPMDH